MKFLIWILMAVPLPNIEKDGVEAVVAWAQSHVEEGERDFATSHIKRADSPAFWGDEIVYAVQIDRFNDGDPSNNHNNVPAEQQAAENATQPHARWRGVANFRHGGDLSGVMARLDYIRDMGATALWLSPVLSHDGSYHGYCTTDLTHVDAGFGHDEDLRTLVALAHARGMRVVLDIVVNHLCDSQTAYDMQPNHSACAARRNEENWQDWPADGMGQGHLAFGPSFFGPLRSQHFFNRCGANGVEDTSGEGPAAMYGDFVPTMFDFDTRNQDFQRIFTDLYKYWIAYADVDGFRMDAAKHVTEDFVAYFSTETRRYASSLGKHNFFVVGEVAASEAWVGRRLGKMFSDPSNPDNHGSLPRSATRTMWQQRDTYLQHRASPYPGLNAVYDFANSWAARDVLLGHQPTLALENMRHSSWQRTLDAQSDPRLHWSHLEIHDWPRFIRTDPHNPWKSMLGLAYLAVAPGIPVIHYGQEQGFNGDCHWDRMRIGEAAQEVRALCQTDDHTLNRQDMFVDGPWKLGSSVDEVDALAAIGVGDGRHGPYAWQEDPMLRRDHGVYQTTRRMLALRRTCAPLRRGTMVPRWGDSTGPGLLAFSRVVDGDEVLVVINTQPVRLPLPPMGMPNTQLGGTLHDALGSAINPTVRLGAWGPHVDFGGAHIDGNSLHVFAAPKALGAWENDLQIRLCKQG